MTRMQPRGCNGTVDSMNRYEESTDPTDYRDELGPADTGRWLVFTKGSVHLWDLDQGTYQRLPGEGRSRFDYDEVVVHLTRVERWPSVGSTSFIWYDDPIHPHTLEQWRQSSTIRRIQRLPLEPRDSTVPD